MSGHPAARTEPTAALWTTPKRDRQPHENEDSVAGNASTGRFAVSDGASTAARSGVWSALLTEAFVRGDDPLSGRVLTELRREWWKLVLEPSLAWHAMDKLAQGSAATFVGLALSGNSYQVTAIGDSCLFHIRKQELLLAAPLNDWTRFSRYAVLVSTLPNCPLAADQLWSGGGQFDDGDVFLLATDAVAKQWLRHYAERGTLWPICDQVGDQAEFARLIEQERERGLDNDDSTICVVRV
jgi:hypothetical protein